MAIIEVTFYSATCDCCDKRWYNDHFGWSAMSDVIGLKDMLMEDEWHVTEDKTYCPSCFEIDDDDNLIIKSSTELKEVSND